MSLRLKKPYQALLLILVTLGIYYPTLFAPFNSLDDQLLVNTLLNQQGFSWSRHFSPGGLYDYYRPLVTLSFEIDHHIGGLQEPFMHLFNVLVHAVNVLLVWLFARRFGRFIRNSSDLIPLLAALLFAVHPIHTETVNWIMGRTDLLAGTFCFAALWSLVIFLERRQMGWGILSGVTLLGGALCKETALFLVPGACFLLVCRAVGGGRQWRGRWLLLPFYSIAIGAYFFLRWGAFQTDRGLSHTTKLVASAVGVASSPGVSEATATHFPWLDAVRVALKASGFYAVKLFQPLPLNFGINHVDPVFLVPGLCLVVLLTVSAWRRQPIGWLFLVAASIAVSALAVLYTQLAWTPVAERYMYIPCGPFLVGLVYLVGSKVTLPVGRAVAAMLVPAVIGGAVWATATRNIVWQDNLTLYQDTVRKSPDFARAKTQLAMALRERGRKEEALALLGENSSASGGEAMMNRAAALWEEGDYEAARAELLELLENPRGIEIKILNNLVAITMEQANKTEDEDLKRLYYEDILGWLKRIYSLWPNGFVSYRIGRVHLILNNRSAAQRAFAKAAETLPPDSLYHEPAAKLARTLAE
ncbi:MAG: hypothetical protein C0616_00265 [Desulfuromonas sp.]|nr:MAG: hypothetical protein C0616_00265 [Desulfuromonas sp.]